MIHYATYKYRHIFNLIIKLIKKDVLDYVISSLVEPRMRYSEFRRLVSEGIIL